MSHPKNIAITGAKQAGKSTLAQWLLDAMVLPYAGFRTLRYAVTADGPLYEMADILSGERAPISRRLDAGIRGIPETFESFGADVVNRAILSPAPVLLLDEIGRFERTSPAFLQSLTRALDSEKRVIAVVKQEPLDHIQAIKVRQDTLLIDLDRVSRARAREILSDWRTKP